MIADYLSELYFNCKAISTKEGSDPNQVREGFRKRLLANLVELGLREEDELLLYLRKPEFRTLVIRGQADIFLTIFYLVNSISEWDAPENAFDELRRYKFENSIQKELGPDHNRVLKLMLESILSEDFLARHFKQSPHQSYFFLSHDIDSLYGSTLQDGLWAIKHFRLDVLFSLLANAALAKPHWFNMDLISQIESDYGFKSTFYWLVNKGRIDRRQTNSDYRIDSSRPRRTLADLSAKGFEHGLHKSISTENLVTERSKMPIKVNSNRYHYLKFKLPEAYQSIGAAGMELDASLGFAEHFGFRNSYGYPFAPYDVQKETAYPFLEVPLNIMDGTFQRYMRLPVNQTANTVTAFLEQHKTNALLSILWHNTFFSNYKYKGYREEYVKILAYLYEEKFVNINQSGIVSQFSWKRN